MTTYIELDELKGELGELDTDRDPRLLRAIEAASASVDGHCGRTFGLDASATAREFDPSPVAEVSGHRVLVDDIGSLSGLVVETGSGSTWTAATGWRAEPRNALAKGTPITSLLMASARWPVTASQSVRVTARWGWPAVPEVVRRATLIQAVRLWKRVDSPEGVVAAGDMGGSVIQVPRVDPDVMRLLAPLRLPSVA